MNIIIIVIFFFIYSIILSFLEIDAFIKNSSSYAIINKIGKINHTNTYTHTHRFVFFKETKLYDVKIKLKRRKNELYSLKSSMTNLLSNIKKDRIHKIVTPCNLAVVKHAFKTNLNYYNTFFNRCKLDRLLITFNVLLHFFLNTVDKKKERKIVFSKGKIIEIKDEKKCEKYKCNYKDIYINKNYKTFFTSLFVHKNIVHLYFNMSSLVSIYKLVSLMYTNTQILTIFLLSGFLSNIMSYIYDSKKERHIFLDTIINKDINTAKRINTNKIICGSSSSIYSLYGLYITYILFFYFKNNYIINTHFLYNFFYSFITSLVLENVSHINHIFGFLCGSFFAFFFIILRNIN